MKKALLFLSLFVTLLCGARGAAALSEEEAELKAHEIAGSLMSPFCAGKLLRDCSSSSAAELRAKVRQRLLAGESVEEVTESLYALYGDDIRAAPEAQGFGFVAWLAPFAFIGVGAIALFLWLQLRRSPPAAPQEEQKSELSEEQREKIRRALIE